MGRHSAGSGESFSPASIPATGSRRAARQAELRAMEQQDMETALAEAAASVSETPLASLYGEELDHIAAVTAEESAKRAPRRSFFASFRSRAALVAAVAASSGVGAVGLAATHSADAANAASNEAALAPVSLPATAQATFTVTVDGNTQTVTSSATTLYTALKEAGIVVGSDDRVSQLMGTQVVDGANVVITRVEKKTITEDVVDVHTSSQVEDASLAKGTTQVQTPGVDGLVTNTYEVTYEDGQEVSRNQIYSTVKSARVDEVVKIGTKESSASAAVDTSGAVAVPAGTSQEIAAAMIGSYGWDSSQMSCLIKLWNKESSWNHLAQNRSSGAYGIPQALPGSKMASAGADWATNPATQIKWGLGYISARYGTPCGAWSHSQNRGWY